MQQAVSYDRDENTRLLGSGHRGPDDWGESGHPPSAIRHLHGQKISEGVPDVRRREWGAELVEGGRGRPVNKRIDEHNLVVHLTFGPHEYTGRDVLTWLGSRIAVANELSRINVPWRAGNEVAQEYFDLFRRLLVETLENVSAEDFVDDVRAAWNEGIDVRLDARIDPWTDSRWNGYCVRLRAVEQARLSVGDDGDTFFLVANGLTHEFDRRCLNLIRALIERREMRVKELKEYDPARLSAEFVDGLLVRLVKDNIVVASPPAR